MSLTKKNQVPKQINHWMSSTKNVRFWFNFTNSVRMNEKTYVSRQRRNNLFTFVVFTTKEGKYLNLLRSDLSLQGYSVVCLMYKTGEVKIRHCDSKTGKYTTTTVPRTLKEFKVLVNYVMAMG